MSPIPVFWTPSGFLHVFYPTRSSVDKQENTNKGNNKQGMENKHKQSEEGNDPKWVGPIEWWVVI